MALRGVGLALVIPATALAQSLVDADHLAGARAAFERAPAAALRCGIKSTRPTLDFGFRFQTGYVIDMPLGQFQGPGHQLTILVKITPDGREPSYLTNTNTLPDVPATKFEGEVTGSFVVGEGAYAAEAMVEDDQHRVCRNRWRIQAKPTGSERELKPAVPAGTVAEVSAVSGGAAEANRRPKSGRLTILLHAAALSPNASKLDADNVKMLTDALSSLLEQLPAQSVRLVVFNLDQHATLLQKDGVKLNDLEEVKSALSKLELSLINYRAIERRDRSVDLLADLFRAELRQPKPPDAVIVLGPKTRSPAGGAEVVDQRLTLPPLFYLQLRPRGVLLGRMGPPPMTEGARGGGRGFNGAGGMRDRGDNYMTLPDLPDSIGQLMSRFKGETFAIWTPHEFADAIRRMAARIPAGAPVEAAAPAPEAKVPPVHTGPLPVSSAPEPAPPTLPVRRLPVPAEQPSAGQIEHHEDPTVILMRLRDQVLQHGKRIPNHTCVETVRRDRYEPATGRSPKSCDAVLAASKLPASSRQRLETTDRLRLDVKLTTDREIYSWAGANKFEEGEIDELIPDGAMGTGPFASMVLAIFETRDPGFVFEGDTDLGGRRVLEYSFDVPKERSNYRVKAQKEWLVTGYTGTLLVDPRTAELVRLSVRTEELPVETSMCELDTALEYGMVPLDGVDYLLPMATRQRFIGRDGSESENKIDFAACREFRGESIVTFGEKAPEGGSDSKHAAPPLTLPAGLPVTVELTSTIRSDQSAAGDRILGRLAKPIRDERLKKILAPDGAILEGRLMRTEARHSTPKNFTIALRWETVEIDGVKTPLMLTPRRNLPQTRIGGFGGLRQRGVPIELPLPGEERYGVYHFPGEGATIEGGFQTEWLTDHI